MRRRSLLAAVASAAACAGRARAADRPVKIGVLTDMSGLYADATGRGGVLAARMATEDYATATGGPPAEVVFADHQNKSDVGAGIARQWLDRDGVDVIVEVINSSVALAVSAVVREKNKAVLFSGASSADLTGKSCSPNTVAWTYDTYMLAATTARGVVGTGAKTWFNLVSDYAFGHTMEDQVRAIVEQLGGKIAGEVSTPLGTSDFSSYLVQAQASGAQAIGLVNAGGDTINSIKQAVEFGLTRGSQRLVAFVIYLTDVHAMGLETAQGLQFTTGWYWNLNEGTVAWARRFAARNGGAFPTQLQAGNYSAVLHYLKAIGAGTSREDGRAVIATMKRLPTDDPLFGQCTVREDGRMMHDVYLCQVRTPGESRVPWDYYQILETIPAARAWRPLNEGFCTLVRAADR